MWRTPPRKRERRKKMEREIELRKLEAKFRTPVCEFVKNSVRRITRNFLFGARGATTNPRGVGLLSRGGTWIIVRRCTPTLRRTVDPESTPLPELGLTRITLGPYYRPSPDPRCTNRGLRRHSLLCPRWAECWVWQECARKRQSAERALSRDHEAAAAAGGIRQCHEDSVELRCRWLIKRQPRPRVGRDHHARIRPVGVVVVLSVPLPPCVASEHAL
ncbi:hypothetical protein HPB50_022406 [Hyalomma asiaticum]|uniref:Uncharacterized protein n=1 Tax=Hyalomma asiaticum TaxID=266040 RepID=A0ACB7TLY4_HYAAI|nr:hypothetical protein HPB50_022406 [Hyalomma asiaticum]